MTKSANAPLPAPTFNDTTSRIVLAHGGGGQLTDDLVSGRILPRLGNDVLNQLLDAAILPDAAGALALTIDAYVVQPWRFPGGDIGRVAVCGTINDLAVSGARPLALALSLILAEGLPIADLDAILDSIAAAAAEANVRVVTGDTKVVGHGQADGIYITTSGIGRIPPGRTLGPQRVRPGQVLLINGPIGEHGLAVMLAREMPDVQTPLRSDVAPLNGLIQQILDAAGDQVTFMRDPTRGGLAGLCADLARQSTFRVVLDEAALPIRPPAQHAADMLGLDILDIANEGKVVLAVDPNAADRILDLMRRHPLGRDSVAFGQIASEPDSLCELKTKMGGRRVVQKPYGEQLPRIC